MISSYIRLTIVWLLLLGATLVAWVLGHAPLAKDGNLPALIIASMLVVSFGKTGLVIAYFMEVRFAPWVLIGLFTAWSTILCAALIGILA